MVINEAADGDPAGGHVDGLWLLCVHADVLRVFVCVADVLL